MRKLSVILLLLAIMASMFAFISCKDSGKTDSPDSGSEQIEPDDDQSKDDGSDVVTVTVSLSAKTLTVEEYKSAELQATVSGSSESVVWTSSNPEIATVDGGNVSGVKAGTATIRAAVGDAYDECAVTVTETTVAPTLEVQESVSVERGSKFEGDIIAKWETETLSGITYSYYFAEGAAADVCAVSFDNGIITITGTKEGSATVVVTAEIRGKTASKEIAVTVREPVLSLSVEGDVTVTAESNSVSLYTVEDGDKKTSATVKFNASYMGYTESVDVTFGDFTTAGVATVSEKTENGYTITKVGAGETEIVASYSTDGKTQTITIKITVDKIVKALENYCPTIDVSKTTTLSVPENLGTVTGATIGDTDVFGSFADNAITLNTENLPKKAADLGENKAMVISTADYVYTCAANVYSMIISTKADLEAFAANAKANGDFTNTGVLDGYYVLGNDIDFNGELRSATDLDEMYNTVNAMADKKSAWNDSAVYGFKGVFDGKGYNIDGLTVTSVNGNNCSSGGLICYMNDAGIVRNVSFTNAGVWENCGFICSYGGGTIENVSVSYKKIGVGNEVLVVSGKTRTMGTFFSFDPRGAKVINCVIDASGAEINCDVSGMRLGTETDDKNVKIENLIVIADDEKYLANSGATTKVLTYSALTDEAVRAAVNDLPDTEWTVINGIPFLKRYAESIDKTKEIAVTTEATEVYGGSTLKIEVNEKYSVLSLKAAYTGVTLKGNVITVADDVESGTLTVVAKSLINDSEVEKTISVYPKGSVYTISERQILDLNATVTDGGITVSDVTIDLSKADGFTARKDIATVTINERDYAGTISGTTLTVTGIAKEAYGEYPATIKVGADTISLKVLIATKVIRTADDFKALNTYVTNISGKYKYIDGYFILGNDIENVGEFTGVDQFNIFKGILDGNGHIVSGATPASSNVNTGVIGELTGTVKNIAFKDLTLGRYIRIVCKGGGTLENVYFGLASGTAACDNGIMYQLGADELTLKNVVFDVSEVSGATEKMTILGIATKVTATNVVVIAKSTLKGVSNNSTDGENLGIYVYYADTKTTNGVAIPDGTWDSAYWTVKKDSVPVFKGMTEPSMSATFEVPEEIEVDGSGAVTVGENCVLELPDGLTYENGRVIVPSDATVGTTYTITVRNIYDMSQKQEKTITVKEANKSISFSDRKTIDLGATVTDGTISPAGTITLDLSSLKDEMNIAENTSAIVTIGNVDYNGTISKDGLVTITELTTAVYGEYDVSVKFANVTVTGKVLVATKVIRTMAEFKSINTLTKALDYNGYYLLGNHIYADSTIADGSRDFLASNQIGESSSTPFLGTIDGNGYNVNYLCMETSLGWIYELKGTVKNIGFANLTLDGSMYLIYRCLGGTVENVYVQLDNARSSSSIFGQNTAGEKFTFKNVVVDVSAAMAGTDVQLETSWAALGRCAESGNEVTFTNTVVIGLTAETKNRVGRSVDSKTYYDGSNFGIYAYYTDGTTNGVAFPASGWDSAYWTVDATTGNTVKWKNA